MTSKHQVFRPRGRRKVKKGIRKSHQGSPKYLEKTFRRQDKEQLQRSRDDLPGLGWNKAFVRVLRVRHHV